MKTGIMSYVIYRRKRLVTRGVRSSSVHELIATLFTEPDVVICALSPVTSHATHSCFQLSFPLFFSFLFWDYQFVLGLSVFNEYSFLRKIKQPKFGLWEETAAKNFILFIFIFIFVFIFFYLSIYYLLFFRRAR